MHKLGNLTEWVHLFHWNQTDIDVLDLNQIKRIYLLGHCGKFMCNCKVSVLFQNIKTYIFFLNDTAGSFDFANWFKNKYQLQCFQINNEQAYETTISVSSFPKEKHSLVKYSTCCKLLVYYYHCRLYAYTYTLKHANQCALTVCLWG